MSFFGLPAEDSQCTAHLQQRRKGIALRLIERIPGGCVPGIAYDLLWESATINAQAWRFRSVRYVRVYGGLVRHRTVTGPGLALILAHTTGHHLGGLPCDPICRG